MNTKGIIKNYLASNKGKIFSVVFLSLLAITFKVLIPISVKLILDYSLLSSNVNDFGIYVIIYSIVFGVSIVGSMVFDSIRQYKLVQFGNSITSELRQEAFQNIMKAELYELNKISNNELASNIVDDTDIVGNKYISSKLIKIFYHCLNLLAMVVTLFVFNITYGVIVLLSIPIFFFADKYLGYYQKKIMKKYEEAKEEHEYIINDRFKQLKTIKTRNGILEENESYNNVLIKNNKIYAKAINLDKVKNVLMPTVFASTVFIIVVATLAFKFYGASDYKIYLNSIGSFIGCLAVIPIVYTELKGVLNLYFTQVDYDGACQRLDKVYSVRGENRTESIDYLDEVHHLKFDSVSFDYAGYGVNDKVSLDNINFELKKGEKLGIIGLTGSGKTTIADLITKVIRPRQGNVLINNCDINKVNTKFIREIVTYISNEYEVLDMSIEKNISYPNALDEYKYNEALNKCKLKDLIFNLPDRDETNARSANLSESDVQKIALAYAFYKESPIIILDEATSKLDAVTEEHILNEFYKLKNKISIVISNRINNVIKCDKILIINNGKVSEYGKVEDLLENKTSTLSKMVKDAHIKKVG